MTDKTISLFQDVSFDPEITSIMGQAYECACKALRDIGQPELVKTVIAKRIIAIAKTGERNPDRLCERALKALGVPPQRA